jgi:uncharacterized membrane protein
MRVLRLLVHLAVAAALASCGDARDLATQPTAQGCTVLPTGATCPPGSTLAYASFGQTFFATYCTRCHASTVTGAARNGATIGVNFDTLDGIRANACRIDSFAGSGPNGTNTIMPFDITSLNPVPPQQFPTAGERAQLSQWLACGAP